MSYNKSNPNGSATSANSSPVVIANDQGTVPVSAASLPLPSGAATAAAQTTGNTSVASIDTKTPALGQALAAASVPVVLTAAQLTTLTPVSTVTANAGTNLNTSALALETGGNLASIKTDVDNLNLAQGSTTSGQKGNLVLGAVTTAAPTYTTAQTSPLSLDTTGALRVNVTAGGAGGGVVTQATGTNLHTVVDSGTVTANIGTSGSLALDATLTGGTAQSKITDGTNVATVKPASTGALSTDKSLVVAISPNNTIAVNTTLINGTNVATSNGTVGIGTQRVAIASDNTPFTVNSQIVPTTSGGLTTFHLASAATTNATNIKASAGQLYGYIISNTSAAYSYVAFHNSASAPTAGASVFFKIGIPAGGGANVEFSNGIPFSSGIGISTVTGAADSNATAVAANDLIINVFYK